VVCASREEKRWLNLREKKGVHWEPKNRVSPESCLVEILVKGEKRDKLWEGGKKRGGPF